MSCRSDHNSKLKTQNSKLITLLLEDRLHAKHPVALVGRVGQHVLARQRGAHLVRAHDVEEIGDLGGRRHAGHVNLFEHIDVVQDVREVGLHLLQLLGREPQPRQLRHMLNFLKCQGHRSSSLAPWRSDLYYSISCQSGVGCGGGAGYPRGTPPPHPTFTQNCKVTDVGIMGRRSVLALRPASAKALRSWSAPRSSAPHLSASPLEPRLAAAAASR